MKRDQVEVVEGEFVELDEEQVAGGVQFYVSGEHLPGQDQERALTVVTEPVGLHQMTDEDRRRVMEDVVRLFEQWAKLDVADGRASPETVRAYVGDVRQHLTWLIVEQQTLPGDVSVDGLKGWRTLLVGRYALSTAGRKFTSVRRFYSMAMDRGMIGANPAAGLKSPKDETDQDEKIKYLTMATVQRVLSLPNLNTARGQRDRAIMVLMAMHGLRVIEVHRLSLEDVDFEAGEAGMLQVLGKRNKRRKVLLVEETREVLRIWLAARGLTRANDSALFVSLSNNREPGRMHRRSIRAMIDKYLVMAGAKRPGVSCHSLRHTFATLSLAAGASLLAISGALGHRSTTTTEVYARIVDKAKHNPAKFLLGLLE